jgi:dTDP-4-dehydrorhamnose reductase
MPASSLNFAQGPAEMRVLITGASGMLGCTLASFLQAQGYELIRHGHHGMADVSCDLTNRDETAELLAIIRPDMVVNLVAATNVDACERQPHMAYLLNVRTVENLVAGIEKNPGPFLIHISTDQVYDAPGASAEDDIRLSNTYALTKYAGELAAQRTPASILRTNFFGSSRHPSRKSFSDWLLDNFRNNKSFTAFADIVTSPLSMLSLSRSINLVLQHPTAGVFNLGSRGGLSKADFAATLAEAFELDTTCMRRGSSIDVALQAYRPKDMAMDSGKFEKTFGAVMPSLADEIRQLRVDEDANS